MAARTRDIAGYHGAELIGQGGFSAVYRAEDTNHGRHVAIKVLDGALGEAERRRFDRERQTMGRLGAHPNIISVYDSGYTDAGEGYIVMQLATGGSLGARLRSGGPMAWPEAVQIMAAVASATQAAHDAGVLHRDIKPDNILIDEYGNPKLSDFGISAVASNVTATMSTTATLSHAAPEVLQGQPATNGVDIYALGSTLCALITGLPPFVRPGDEGVTPMITRALTEAAPDLRLRGFPDGVARVIETALAKDARDRQPTAAQMAAELRGIIAPNSQPASSQAGPSYPGPNPGYPGSSAPTVVSGGVPVGAGHGGLPSPPGVSGTVPPGWGANSPAFSGPGADAYGANPYSANQTVVGGSTARQGFTGPSTGSGATAGSAPAGQQYVGPAPFHHTPKGKSSSGRTTLVVLVGLVVVALIGVVAWLASHKNDGVTSSTTSTIGSTTTATGPSSTATALGGSTTLPGTSTASTITASKEATVSIDCPTEIALNTKIYCTINSSKARSGQWTLPGFVTGPQPIQIVPGAYQIYIEPTNLSVLGSTFVITATVVDQVGATATAQHQFTVVGPSVSITCPDSIALNATVVCQVESTNATEGDWTIPNFGGAALQTVPGANPITITPSVATAVGHTFTITATVRDAAGASAIATHDFTVTKAGS